MAKLVAPLALYAFIGFVLATPVAAVTAAQPSPRQVYINSISYCGSGCPQGSIGSFLSADRQTFTFIFDSYTASIGPGVATTENSKNCQLSINLEYPSGFQYSVFSAIYRGYVGLDVGVTALQKSTYYFSGQPAQVSTQTNFTGPIAQDFEVSDAIQFSSVIWSPCGAAVPMSINSQVLLTSTKTTATGQITDESIDGNITHLVSVKWQKCTI